MSKNYQIFYNGLFMGAHLTRSGAESHAYRLAKEKNWNVLKIEIRTAVFDKTGMGAN